MARLSGVFHSTYRMALNTYSLRHGSTSRYMPSLSGRSPCTFPLVPYRLAFPILSCISFRRLSTDMQSVTN